MVDFDYDNAILAKDLNGKSFTELKREVLPLGTLEHNNLLLSLGNLPISTLERREILDYSSQVDARYIRQIAFFEEEQLPPKVLSHIPLYYKNKMHFLITHTDPDDEDIKVIVNYIKSQN